MFNPFGTGQNEPSPQANGAAESAKPQAPAENDAAIDELKRKLDELQGQLAELSKKTT